MTERKPAGLSIRLRSLLFYVASALLALPFLALMPLIILPVEYSMAIGSVYLNAQLWLLRVICGVRYEVTGLPHLPKSGCLIASQHESSWETLYFQVLLGQPVMYAKKEVFGYPLIGFLARKFGHISVDRKGSADAMREGFRAGREAARAGRRLLIFPTGTRSLRKDIPIQSGIGVLYQLVDLPAVPVLLNSGHCWPADSNLKYPGTIRVQIQPAIPAGLDRREFLERLSKDLSQSV